ncbi:hypothetical protein ACFWOJ_37465 [Streptomyces sp. NPDC058439]|uniref:hypothetical protein n=1 Tax=Streptomyces sp. NPDC058439 TaxID=3346500 RepID=UPI00364FD238
MQSPQHAELDTENSWEAYGDAEFGISRAHAYRLLDVARALSTIQTVVGTDPSRTRETNPAAAAALDYGPARPHRRLRPLSPLLTMRAALILLMTLLRNSGVRP